MSNRSAKFASALVASILAGANFTAVAQNAATTADTKAADSCQSAPKGPAGAGKHWYYHQDRTTKAKCWYIGEAKNKAAKTATAQQQPSPEATADATPPQPQAQPQPQPQSAMRPSVADAHAELALSQAAAAPAATPEASQPGSSNTAPDTSAPATPPDANAQTSARWLDATSMAGSNGTRHAAPQPPAPEQADAQQPSVNATAPAAPAAVETTAEKTSSSTQMLLIVMVGALALAGLVSALVLRLTRRRTPPSDIQDEWHAPWASMRSPDLPIRLESPLRLSELPPRRPEPPMPRRAVARNLDETEDRNQQITAMLQRLARSTAN